mmetsp:Transcript_4789/g.4523  ORF Transcript_4789/g.4523 Transcript_4789/m.4523 type:complete len:279 (-) Transcript_4789:47-883(-)|eukprot:CAMPEP_0196997256 /NCGR_PEP_ID=MMETSP1380-20130617/2924_1 /TAXON_ID=5936 /ORGANISM="Euplotes crassus, Strain CT5" /LENGTH=278 /DNA_ID=CAMNT_0042413443 /DNA_START=74 /DNA_END=910 /DNA_ORIENTATION=-
MTGKVSNKSNKKSKRLFKTRDVDGCSESGLDEITLPLLDGDEGTETSYVQDKYSEISIPLNKERSKYDRQKRIIRGEDIEETITSSEITKTIEPNYNKRRNLQDYAGNRERTSSVDSEEERYNRWQRERENKLHAVNYVKNDKIYTEPAPKNPEKERSQEKRKLKNFLTTYKNDRFKPKNSKRSSSIKSHLTDYQKSSAGKVSLSGNTSTKIQKTKESGGNSMNEEISEKRETNFFDIFMAISKPIIDEKKSRKRRKKRAKRQARAHSNAMSEPNFLR